jgi:osmoprotectant transport system ATP-binding protein
VESFLGEDRALKRLNLVRVREIVTDEIGTVTPSDTLETALSRIDDFGYLNSILMVNDRHQPAGVITRAVARTTKGYCRDHFQSAPPVVRLDDDLRKVASLMFASGTTWLSCVDDDGRVSGQITQRAMTHHLGSRFRTREAAIRNPASAVKE